MTKQELEDYRFLLLELKRLRKKGEVVADIVTGSSPEFPYHKHTMTVSGAGGAIPHTAELEHELLKQCGEVECFIASLPNAYCRLLVKLRVLEGMEWRDVALELDKSEYAVKKAYERLTKRFT